MSILTWVLEAEPGKLDIKRREPCQEIFVRQLLFKRGSYMVWEINMGVCPCLEFDNIMFINCLGYDFYIYGDFEFLCNSIAKL